MGNTMKCAAAVVPSLPSSRAIRAVVCVNRDDKAYGHCNEGGCGGSCSWLTDCCMAGLSRQNDEGQSWLRLSDNATATAAVV